MKSLDPLDRKILSLLQSKGRMTNSDLAKQINLSPTPCLERVRRLEREGYILGYSAKLDPELMLCGFLTYVSVNLDKTSENVFQSFADKIKALPEVVECHMVGGGFDYLLKVRTADMAGFRKFLGDALSIMPEVGQTHSYFVMETVKETASMPISGV